MVTSGIRLGAPAGTTRGFGIAEFRDVGRMIAEVLDGLARNGEAGNAATEAKVKGEAIALCQRFPIYARDLQARFGLHRARDREMLRESRAQVAPSWGWMTCRVQC